MLKRVDERRIKTHHNYTAEEAAQRLGVHPQTIHLWEKKGLKPIDDRRPRLYRGHDIRVHIKTVRQSQKQPCGEGEMYCLKCRSPRRPAFNIVEFHECSNGATGNLRALCNTCTSVMNQRASDRTRIIFERLYTVEYR
ncbi:MAG: MerR family DNA-binding transcriptional regulator [Pseudomonadota bacterium]